MIIHCPRGGSGLPIWPLGIISKKTQENVKENPNLDKLKYNSVQKDF